MGFILGLDPSLQKAGYVVLDINKPDNIVEDKGLLKTSTNDGILIQRLIKQISQIENKIKSYDISFVGMEAPFFGAGSTEMLFALNQFIHKLYLDLGIYAVCFPPQMLKKLVFPHESVSEIHKPHMIDRAKTILELHGKRLAEDVADAYWAGIFGKKYYNWHIRKILTDEDLGDYEYKCFKGSHTFVKGSRKGDIDYSGIIYRENELFFDFKEIKRRTENATQGNKKDNRPKRSSNNKRGCSFSKR
jgi:Holliday junction resolvasome RuvABC endonuclease subunit